MELLGSWHPLLEFWFVIWVHVLVSRLVVPVFVWRASQASGSSTHQNFWVERFPRVWTLIFCMERFPRLFRHSFVHILEVGWKTNLLFPRCLRRSCLRGRCCRLGSLGKKITDPQDKSECLQASKHKCTKKPTAVRLVPHLLCFGCDTLRLFSW